MQYYLRARYYNPVVGRFLQEDTYRGDGLNLYAYCANNPVGYNDPSGYVCESTEQNGPPKTQGNPISFEEAKILDEWAKEYNVKQHRPAIPGSGAHFPGGNSADHTHIYNIHDSYVYK